MDQSCEVEVANFKFVTQLHTFHERCRDNNWQQWHQKVEAFVKSDKMFEMQFKSTFN